MVDRLKIINFVTQYFNAIKYFLNVELLPKQIQENPTCQIIQSDFTSIIEYANKRLVIKYLEKKTMNKIILNI